MVPPLSAVWWRRARGSFRVIVLAMLLAASGLITQGCDSVPLTAPRQSTIDLVVSSEFVPLGGSIEVTAILTEQAGTPVHDGTTVSFTTTLGTIEPARAQTDDGRATARLHAGNESGSAFIRAFSGEAATGEEGLEVRVGAGGATEGEIRLILSPGSLPAGGGTADVIAVVTDENNRALPNVPVTFSATAGTLRDTRVTTNANGEARTTITTTRETEVTAAVGGTTTTETLSVTALPEVDVSFSPNDPDTEDVVTFSIQVTQQDNGNPVQNVSIAFGDGTGEELGPVSGTAETTHRYPTPGTYSVRVSVTDTAGESVERTLTITVTEPEEEG